MRIVGIELKESASIWLELTRVYGIGKSISQRICKTCGVELNRKVRTLDVNEVESIKAQINDLLVEGELKHQVAANIKRLKTINCYRGMRHKRNLPVRGQRTRTNSRNARKKNNSN